jgi:hypothetical protein
VSALPTIIQFYRDRGYTFVDLAGGTGNRLPDISPAGVAAVGTSAGSIPAFGRGTGGVVTSAPALAPWDPTQTAAFARGSDRALG